ncbi:Hypothetical protein CHC_T00008891001 [Chondrus crispus]|uniref:Uncharacterized protein n=1 Tax=Chondrus crispus TaxID=2769 RepID=R7QST5_CHOCR|nr:Hypothetical protein CHC_T00008891001 [Chondrus crispus]CDF40566.1 Hypothetical protein CHC_T00008891001 [Chondrus crispus]|eukprot:XP_005710860.1 Hypothetical protein CHC_T00008891001 [Chondrus crispus]
MAEFGNVEREVEQEVEVELGSIYEAVKGGVLAVDLLSENERPGKDSGIRLFGHVFEVSGSSLKYPTVNHEAPVIKESEQIKCGSHLKTQVIAGFVTTSFTDRVLIRAMQTGLEFERRTPGGSTIVVKILGAIPFNWSRCEDDEIKRQLRPLGNHPDVRKLVSFLSDMALGSGWNSAVGLNSTRGSIIEDIPIKLESGPGALGLRAGRYVLRGWADIQKLIFRSLVSDNNIWMQIEPDRLRFDPEGVEPRMERLPVRQASHMELEFNLPDLNLEFKKVEWHGSISIGAGSISELVEVYNTDRGECAMGHVVCSCRLTFENGTYQLLQGWAAKVMDTKFQMRRVVNITQFDFSNLRQARDTMVYMSLFKAFPAKSLRASGSRPLIFAVDTVDAESSVTRFPVLPLGKFLSPTNEFGYVERNLARAAINVWFIASATGYATLWLISLVVCTYLRNEEEIDEVSSLVRAQNELFDVPMECRLASRRPRNFGIHHHESSYGEPRLGTLEECDEPAQVQDFNSINSLPNVRGRFMRILFSGGHLHRADGVFHRDKLATVEITGPQSHG